MAVCAKILVTNDFLRTKTWVYVLGKNAEAIKKQAKLEARPSYPDKKITLLACDEAQLDSLTLVTDEEAAEFDTPFSASIKKLIAGGKVDVFHLNAILSN